MTPLAARLFRTTDDVNLRISLAASQFFETSAIYDLALEMVQDDLAAGCLTYSDMAQLPSPVAVIEFMFGGDRVLLLTTQKGSLIEWLLYAQFQDEIRFSLGCGFEIGSGRNLDQRWDEEALDLWSNAAGFSKEVFLKQQATGINGILEKMLCMINQPGLVDQSTRAADKRVLREAKKDFRTETAAQTWHECRIRPGRHGDIVRGDTGAERKLHYVRKYFKPSIGRWVDGYWRGNADLGIHLKWYSATPALGAFS